MSGGESHNDGGTKTAVAVIIPAAGLSSRFGRDKLREPLAGILVLIRTISAFLEFPTDIVECVIIAVPDGLAESDRPSAPELNDPRLIWVAGGDCRARSVQSAVAAVPAGIEWIAVHDAARPLVSTGLIMRCIDHAHRHGNASPAMPVKLTVKEAAGPLPAIVRRTLVRGDLWEMQTPQVMRRIDLIAAFHRCTLPLEQVTDDAQLLELAGQPVWLVDGEERNLKITTPTDLVLAELLLSDRIRADSHHTTD